jgi:exodeoxyribonuclease VII small subunit
VLDRFAAARDLRLMLNESKEPQSFDQVLSELKAVVERLEGGSLSLEQSLAAFEDGVRLSRRAAQMLDAAEHRVEVLLRDEGGERVAPFTTLPKPDDTGGK